MFFDAIALYPRGCPNEGGFDLRGDVNGDCAIDFADVAALSSGWLNSGL